MRSYSVTTLFTPDGSRSGCVAWNRRGFSLRTWRATVAAGRGSGTRRTRQSGHFTE